MKSDTLLAVVVMLFVLIIGTSLLTVSLLESKPAKEYIIVQGYSKPANFVVEKENPQLTMLAQRLDSIEKSINQKETEYYTQRYIEHYSGYNYDEEYDLEITVKDDDSGGRIDDARVHIEDGESKTRRTDEDGEAAFYDLEEDCYDVEVTADDYYSEDRRICLEDDEAMTVRLERR